MEGLDKKLVCICLPFNVLALQQTVTIEQLYLFLCVFFFYTILEEKELYRQGKHCYCRYVLLQH
jgi:hypothetical protein